MQVVILAGGLGTRLRPLTLTVPKPMMPIKGRPFLEYQLAWVRRFEFSRVLLLTGYLGEQIESHFQDGRRWDLSIAYSRESSPLGTAGALKQAASKLEDRFLLLNGDTYLPIDYRAMCCSFRQGQDVGVMAVCHMDDGHSVNNVALSENGQVSHYAKEGGARLTHVAAGAYIFDRVILEQIPERVPYSLEIDLTPALIATGLIRGYPTSERFYDIGSAETLRVADQFLTSKVVPSW